MLGLLCELGDVADRHHLASLPCAEQRCQKPPQEGLVHLVLHETAVVCTLGREAL